MQPDRGGVQGYPLTTLTDGTNVIQTLGAQPRPPVVPAEGLDLLRLPGRDFTRTNDGNVVFPAADVSLMNIAEQFRLGAGDADALVPVVADPLAMVALGFEKFRKVVPKCLLGPQDA